MWALYALIRTLRKWLSVQPPREAAVTVSQSMLHLLRFVTFRSHLVVEGGDAHVGLGKDHLDQVKRALEEGPLRIHGLHLLQLALQQNLLPQADPVTGSSLLCSTVTWRMWPAALLALPS